MAEKRNQRKKIWIHSFQTHLFLLFLLYSILYQFVVLGLVLTWQTALAAFDAVTGDGPPAFLYFLAPMSLTMLAIFFIYDGMKFTHRIVGPLYRFQVTIRSILDGKEVPLITLRKGDYLMEMKDEINELLQLLEQRGVVTLKQPPAAQNKQQSVSV
jgi:hypothetical protein